MAHATPAGMATPDQEPQPLQRRPHLPHIPLDEEIYGFYHPHPIVFLRSLLRPLIAFIILLILTAVLTAADGPDAPGWVQAVAGVVHVVLLAGLIALIPWVFYNLIDWRADYIAITARRLVVNMEHPGIHRDLREVPMGKIQNVVTHHAGLQAVINKLLRVGTLVIDTAGMGQLAFHSISEHDAEEACSTILALQKGVRAKGELPRREYRQQVVQSILYGGKPPPAPRRTTIHPHPRTGYEVFNRLFPRRPMREGLKVTWHKHWWFLLKAEAKPLLAFVLFEITTLAVSLVGGLLGLTDNPVANVLTIIRPIFYILLLPWGLWQWENWRNDEYIVDNNRIASIDTLPFGLDQTIKETEIRRVVDATVTVYGPTANLLRFGNVVIKTPGEATQFLFEGVPRPFEVHQEIMNRIEAQREQEQVQWDRDIQDWLRAYVDQRRAEPAPPAPQPPASEGWFL